MFESLLIAGLLAQTGTSESIDRYVRFAAERDGVELSESIDDDQFLRRVTLDLVGRIPTDTELLAFRQTPDRSGAVDRLLSDPAHARFWSRVWTSTLIGYGRTNQADRESLRGWLEESFREKRGFDRIAYDLLSAEGRGAFDGPTNFILRHARDPVVPVGRIFLGVQLDCARCHDHPNDRWTEEDFRNFARFFSHVQVRQPVQGTYEVSDRSADSSGDRPRFLTGAVPKTRQWRQELSLLVIHSKPFARAIANRLWYHFFGHGIASSPDAVNGSERCEDFALITELAERLTEEDFRLDGLIRAICLSDAYARRVSVEHPNWLMMPTVKPMLPDQLYDSMLIAMDQTDQAGRREEFLRSASGASLDETFVNAWDQTEPVQTLMTRLNIALPGQARSHRDIFRRVLSRDPTKDELELCTGQTTSDVLFALIHSNEFYFWH